MIVLAIDTCLDACSAAVWAEGRRLASATEPMRRGHQERLAGLVAETMAAAGAAFADVERVGVTVGPGSFTGLRVGLAFAKGLGLALSRPVIGVGVLEALAADQVTGFCAAVVDARRGQVYVQAFAGRRPLMGPDVLPVAEAAARVAELYNGGAASLVGPGAALLAGVLPNATLVERPGPDPDAIARLAAEAQAPFPPPRPLYLRAPDATPA